jgi:flagellar basal-body rod protein FlgF
MNNALYVGLSRQMALQREMDVIANNIANSDTAGFKVESMKFETDPETPHAVGNRPGPINFVLDSGLQRDFSQGPLRTTGAPLDLGLQGDGFFQVTTKEGVRFTRDGRFAMDALGQIVDSAGDTVNGDSGGPIILDPLKGAPSIAADGTISQIDKGVTTIVGRIGVVKFDSKSALQKTAEGQYANVANATPVPARGTTIVQGMIEGSNVNAVVQMSRMIAVSRAYETIASLMGTNGDTSDQAIQRLARATAQ